MEKTREMNGKEGEVQEEKAKENSRKKDKEINCKVYK